MTTRFLKPLALVIATLIGLTAAGSAWLINTQAGTRWLITTVTSVLPMLSVREISGTLSDLRLRDFRLQTDAFELHADDLRLTLALRKLLSREVHVTDASVTRLTMAVIDRDTSEADDEPIGRLSLPVNIVVDTVSARDVSLTAAGLDFHLQSLEGGYRWAGESMEILSPSLSQLSIRLPQADRSTTPTVTPGETELYRLLNSLQHEALITLPETAPSGVLPFDLTLDTLTLNDASLFESSDAPEPLFSARALSLTASLLGHRLDIAELKGQTSLAELPSFDLTGRLSFEKDWQTELTAQLQTRLSAFALGTVSLQMKGALARTLTLTAETDGEVRSRLSAEWSPALKGIPGKADLSLLNAQVIAEKQTAHPLRLGPTTIRLRGRADSWSLTGKSSLERDTMPPAAITVSGHGRPDGLSLSELRLQSEAGNADFQGTLTWKDCLRWKGHTRLDNLNLEVFSSLPARHLQGSTTLSGFWVSNERWETDLSAFKLKGDYLHQPLAASGSVTVKDRLRIDAPAVSLSLGQNKAQLRAKLERPHFEADLQIDAPALDEFDAQLAGRLKGSVLLRGNPQHPIFIADVQAHHLRWGMTKLESAVLKGTVQPDRHGTVGGRMTLTAGNLTDERLASLRTQSLQVTLEGTEHAHRLHISAKGEPVAGTLRLDGRFDRQTADWHGQLTRADLTTPTGRWREESPASIVWRSQTSELTMAPHAWTHPDARIRFDKPLVLGRAGEVSVVLERLGLTALNPLVPRGLALSGSVSGRAHARWFADPDRSPLLSAQLTGQTMAVHRDIERSDGGEVSRLTIPFDDVFLSADLSHDRARLDWRAALASTSVTPQAGRLSGHLQIEDPADGKRLKGEARMDTLELGFLDALFLTGEKTAGTASGALTFGGSLSDPSILGQIEVKAFQITGGMTPVEMAPSDLQMRFTGHQSILTALLRSDSGNLAVNGLADWTDLRAPSATVRAQGSNLLITVPPYATVRVSPDVQIEAHRDLIRLNGLIDIPTAKIIVTELPPATIGVSRDEVMLTETLQPVSPRSAQIPIASQLRIRLGDDVHLNAFGLKTRLAGSVEVMQTKRGLGLNGQLDLVDGRFKAYGQDLEVERGKVIFAGPVDRPTLDVSAIRNPDKTEDDVIVGIFVTGTADAPKVEVFSRPSMPREEALTYLLRGHGTEEMNNDDNAALTSALIGLGISQTGNLVGTIGNAFGISDLGVDTTGTGDNAQVVVSGYVLPRLQVKYGVGLFDSLTTLTLRYRLMPKLFLESISGVNQSVDLLYRFEF